MMTIMVMIMIMTTMMMMTMRIKTICDVINKSRIKLKVVMIMQIELAIPQSKRQLSAFIVKTSFIELENKELYLCSSLSNRLQSLGTPLSAFRNLIPSPTFSLQKLLRPPPPQKNSLPTSPVVYKMNAALRRRPRRHEIFFKPYRIFFTNRPLVHTKPE